MPETSNVDTLVMVFTIFRHGERAPLLFHPDDPNKDHWVDGIGNLTNEGKGQAYSLGEKYRQRYDGFLGAKYVSKDLYVYSTDSDRCIMTAQCCLAAIYPPIGQNKWHPTLQWQPIPVHTTPEAHDPLEPSTAPFDNVVESLKNLCISEKQNKLFQSFVENQELWKRWRNVTGEGGDVLNVINICIAFDTAFIEIAANLPSVVPKSELDFVLSCPALLDGVVLVVLTHPYYVKQGASLLAAILEQMNGHIDGKPTKKMFMYCVHDLTLYSLMGQLNVTLERTKYCGSLTFELHRLQNKQFYVKIQFRLSLDSEPVDIQLVDNQTLCPIETFGSLVKEAQMRAEIIGDKITINGH